MKECTWAKPPTLGGGVTEGDGEGLIIHCSTTVKRGNAYTDNSPWTHWGIPKGLYATDELRKAGLNVDDEKNIPTLRRGNQGDEVADLQMLLNSKFGYKLDIDGDFGSKTEAAVRDFQRKKGLTADGLSGRKPGLLGVPGAWRTYLSWLRYHLERVRDWTLRSEVRGADILAVQIILELTRWIYLIMKSMRIMWGV